MATEHGGLDPQARIAGKVQEVLRLGNPRVNDPRLLRLSARGFRALHSSA